jgi:tight adherence protein B
MNPAWIHALVLVCIFAAVVLVAESGLRRIAGGRAENRAIQSRMQGIGRSGDAADRIALLRRVGFSVPSGLPSVMSHLAIKLDRMLLQAQLRVETPRLILLILIAPVAIFFALLLLMSAWWGIGVSLGRIVICATFAFVLGTVLPLMAVNWKATRIRKKIEDQFPVALDVFVRGLRAGYPIAAALDLLTVEMPAPIGPEFGLVVNEVTYGVELRDALHNMAERWDLEDMRMFVVSLSIQSETGGNLAEILENLSRVIRERHSMMMKVRALSSEGRMTAVMLTVLPILTFALLFLLNPAFFLDVANDPWFIPGFSCLVILYLIGFFTIRRMVDLKV